MNFHLISYRALVKQVKRLADAQERLAQVAETTALNYFGYVAPTKVKLSDEDKQVDVIYTDEEMDLVREMRSKLGNRAHDESDDEVL